MEKILDYSKLLLPMLGTTIAWLFGTWDNSLTILIVFMILDYVTGVIKAFMKKEISSDIGLRGIARKSLILIVLIVAVLLDRLINNETWLFRTVVCYFYIANEAISLLENVAGMGLTIPAQLQEALIQLKSGNKKEINKDAQ